MIQALYVDIARAFKSGFSLDVQFETDAGITVLCGPSGAGKSLTLDCIAGLDSPDRGTIRLGSAAWLNTAAGIDFPAQQRRCGYVFQQESLFPHLTLEKNLEFGAEESMSISGMLSRFRLDGLGSRYPRELSGGQRQRGAIARALLHRPQLLLLDEPTRGLDAGLRGEFFDIIKDVRERDQIPILLVTHDPEETRVLGEQVIRIANGRVVSS